MKIAIIYATNSGSTFQVAEILGATLEGSNSVSLIKADDFDVRTTGEYDCVVLGSPSWRVKKDEGSPHEAILGLFDRWQIRNLHAKKFAIFGCGDSSYTNFCGAVGQMEKFVSAVGGTLVTQSLKIDAFYFDLKNNQKLAEAWALHLLKVL